VCEEEQTYIWHKLWDVLLVFIPFLVIFANVLHCFSIFVGQLPYFLVADQSRAIEMRKEIAWDTVSEL
jgi:hypothetical protein